jgi:hypothetical protein
MLKSGSKIRVSIKAESTGGGLTTGAYESAIFEFAKPTPAVLESFTFGANSIYMEKTAYIGAGDFAEYDVIFEAGGNKLIQTFGPLDAYLYIYNSAGTLLMSNDDAGYGRNALISFTASARTTYRVVVRFYSAAAYGSVKTAFIASKTLPSSYESIPDMRFSPGVLGLKQTYSLLSGFTATLQTITPDADAQFHLYTSMSVGAKVFLFLIDPAVTTPAKTDEDPTLWQAMIFAKLYAGTPHLALIAANTPGAILLEIDKLR